MFGAVADDRLHTCLALLNDLVTPDLEPIAIGEFSERALGETGAATSGRYSYCCPVLAPLALLCGDTLFRDGLFYELAVSDSIETGNLAFSIAMKLAFQCSPRATPLAFFSRYEAFWNFHEWMARFRTATPMTADWAPLTGPQQQQLVKVVCPGDQVEPLPATPTVECVVPAAWPEEAALMHEIARTWARDCTSCAFVVAVRPGVPPAPASIGACGVVDIAEGPMVDEPRGYQANQAKLQATLMHGLATSTQEWLCFVDADVHFAVPNFRRLVARHRLHPDAVTWIGYTYTSTLMQEGLMVEPTVGACTSRGGVRRFRESFPGFDREGDVHLWKWPPELNPCKRMPVPHSTGFTMAVATACFRRAGIFPVDPSLTHDARGRLLYFNFNALRPELLTDPQLKPPRVPVRVDDISLNITRYYWQGREYIYGMCENARWIGYYPVVFHGHITHDPGYMEAFAGSSKAGKKRDMFAMPSHLEVYTLLARHNWRLPDDLPRAISEAKEAVRRGEHP